MKPLSCLITVVLASVLCAPASAQKPTGRDIMDKQKKRHDTSEEREVTLMRLINKRGKEKQRTMVMCHLKDEDGLSKTMIKFLKPKDIANVGLLTWEQRDKDDDQWLYLPASGKVKRIASSSKKNKFMGTDLAYEDLRPENLDQHAYALTGEEKVDGHDCYVIESTPSTPEEKKSSGYTKRVFRVRKDVLVTIKTEFYGRGDKLVKTSVVHAVENVKGDVYRATKSTVTDVRRKTKTVMEAQERSLDPGLDASFFTQRNLKKDMKAP